MDTKERPDRQLSPLNIIGKRFGRLVVIDFVKKEKPGNTKWLCRCDCGKEKIIYGCKLKNGQSSSCGCYAIEIRTKHKMANTPEYNSWYHMIYRCNNPKAPNYSSYGGRGIKVYEPWLRIENFIADMGKKPGANYSIDRIDVNGNYEPLNCKWSTPIEQGVNKRNNRILCIDGKTMTSSQASRAYNIPKTTISTRLKRGQDVFGNKIT